MYLYTCVQLHLACVVHVWMDLFLFVGEIHGLCFQEEQQSQEIGELLTK